MNDLMIASPNNKVEEELYMEKSICPLCHNKILKSEYLNEIFSEEPHVEWLANLVMHYWHNHIDSWNRCWGRNGSAYRGHWFGDYDEEKSKVNERAKRQLIKKGSSILIKNGIKPEHFQMLSSTTEETMIVAYKKLV